MNNNLLNKKKKLVIFNESYLSDKKININEIISNISRKVKEAGSDLSISRDEFYIVIDEAVANALEHGNKWDPVKKIHLKVLIDSKSLRISIADEGGGFNKSEIFKDLRILDVNASRGRGILLIKRFCAPRWNKKGNQINLSIDLK